MSLIDELKRRNVFKVTAAYLALSWVVTEVTGAVVPALHLPDSIPSIVVWMGVIGFPFVVVFAWAYELTPEGLKRESEVDRSQSITHVTSRRLDYIIIAMLAMAMLLFVFDRFSPRRSELLAAPPVAATPAPTATTQVAAPLAAPVMTVDDKSIAVLPFLNVSEDANNAYFSDGLAEELLNLLAKVPQLHVAARTSSFSFKGQNLEIPEIAKRLNVAHVLEGSVRKSGNHVRITAQLVRADNGYHLWSETYDRTLDDIFVVQDEIAGAVVAQLKITLLGAAPRAREANTEAYALYLQARQLGRQYTAASFEQSNTLYQQALALDPDYAAAWDGLATNYASQANNGLKPVDEGYRLTREAADKALAIDPDYAPAHATLSRVSKNDGDLATAALHLERALSLEPANIDVIGEAARLALSLGRFDAAFALMRYAIDRDPVNIIGHHNLGIGYAFAGRLDDAIASFRTVLALSPGRLAEQYSVGETLLRKGDYTGALAAMQQEQSNWGLLGLPLAYHALGRHAESDAALADVIRQQEQGMSYNIAYVMAYRGEADRAFEWLDKAVTYRDPGLIDIAVEPLFASIHEDPRWLPFLRKLGKAPEQLAAIKFDVKVPGD